MRAGTLRTKRRPHALDNHLGLARLQTKGIDREPPRCGVPRRQINSGRALFELSRDIDRRATRGSRHKDANHRPQLRPLDEGNGGIANVRQRISNPRRYFGESRAVGGVVTGTESLERREQANDLFLAHLHRATQPVIRNAMSDNLRIDQCRGRIP